MMLKLKLVDGFKDKILTLKKNHFLKISNFIIFWNQKNVFSQESPLKNLFQPDNLKKRLLGGDSWL